MQIVEYENKYLEDVRDLLVELEDYIVSIDKDNLDIVHQEYREKMAIKDNKVVGLIMGCIFPYEEYDYLDYKCPRRGEITELIVNKKARSKGIGNLLMNKIEEYFKEKDCEYIFVEVFGYNDNAFKFYSKDGYHTRMNTMIKKI